MYIDREVIKELCNRFAEKKISQKLLFECLKSFLDFAAAEYCYNIKTQVFSPEAQGESEYTQMISQAERVLSHSKAALPGMVTALNKMAAREGLSLVYEGELNSGEPSEELLSAVLDYAKSLTGEKDEGMWL